MVMKISADDRIILKSLWPNFKCITWNVTFRMWGLYVYDLNFAIRLLDNPADDDPQKIVDSFIDIKLRRISQLNGL